MILLSDEQAGTLFGQVPAGTLDYLSRIGMPELMSFRGIEFMFDLSFSPTADGTAFRVGTADRTSTLALARPTGALVIADGDGSHATWRQVNSSVAAFVSCWEASERVWDAERSGQVVRDERGRPLADAVRRIDPAVVADPENAWAVLIEELNAGVV